MIYRKSSMLRILCLSICILFLSNCRTTSYTPYDYPGEIIRVGTGGGFTGQLREFCLLSNGQLFFGTHKEGNVQELEALTKEETRQIFRSFHFMKFSDLEIDKPGNMYHYIKFSAPDNEHFIQWGAHDANPPRELTIFFANLKKDFNNRARDISPSSKQIK